MSDEVASRFVSLKALRIRIITRMEAMRTHGMRYDNQALLANISDTDELAREHGRRETDRDDPVHPDLEEP